MIIPLENACCAASGKTVWIYLQFIYILYIFWDNIKLEAFPLFNVSGCIKPLWEMLEINAYDFFMLELYLKK